MIYNVVVSLGSSCFCSTICKDAQLKRFSCPFDWIFSGVDVIIDCLYTDFEVFLDKTQYEAYMDTCKSAIHKKYGRIFLHHDPRLSEDHDYFSRCVDRFKRICKSNSLNVMFLMTQYNKRQDEIHGIIQDAKRLLEVLRSHVICNFNLVVLVHTLDEVDPTNVVNICDGLIFKTVYVDEMMRDSRFPNNEYMKLFVNFVLDNFEYSLIEKTHVEDLL